MDRKDLEILRNLVEDSRLSLGELSEITGLAVSTVHKRIMKLTKEEYIDKFTIILNPEKFGCVTAFLLVDADSEKIPSIVERLRAEENVLEIYESLGNHNLVLKIRASNLEILKGVVNRISETDGVYSFEFYLATSRFKEEAWKPEKLTERISVR
ncbi:MAG: Lrp/AsnC family transcriptional regulator [Archaeoglobus sp.]|nr:Lrp/AsnC family transcriptional regulator [Archaeoglobus sp.]